jgi:hypothetical protein
VKRTRSTAADAEGFIAFGIGGSVFCGEERDNQFYGKIPPRSPF